MGNGASLGIYTLPMCVLDWVGLVLCPGSLPLPVLLVVLCWMGAICSHRFSHSFLTW